MIRVPASSLRKALESITEQLSLGLTTGPALTRVDVAQIYLNAILSLGWESGAILWFDEKRERLACLTSNYAVDFPLPYLASDPALTLRVAKRGAPLCGTLEQLKDRYPEALLQCRDLRLGDLHDFTGVPLLSGGIVVGVLKLENFAGEVKTPVRRRECIRLASIFAKMLTHDLEFAAASVIKTKSAKMVEALESAHRCAEYESGPVLIFGKDGSGKHLFARLVHRHSARRAHPFTILNCRGEPEVGTSVSEMVLDYVNGIGEHREMLREQILKSRGGTLLLNDIHELTRTAQRSLARLAELLEKRNVRFLVTTTHDPRGDSERFAESNIRNLFAGSMIEVPPLAERAADIELLTSHFAEILYFDRGQGKPPGMVRRVSDSFATAVRQYLRGKESRFQVGDLRKVVEQACQQQDFNLEEVLAELWGAPDSQSSFKRLPKEEKERVFREKHKEMVKRDWTIKRLAEELGVDDRTVFNYFKDLNLSSPRGKNGKGAKGK